MHVLDQPLVSPDTVLVSQFWVCVTPVGSHAKATVTLSLYQPAAQPPPLHVTEIGAAAAGGANTRSGRQTASNATG
jgi:hypothetical protein